MPYSPQTWANDDPTTPINATRLTHMETGIAAAGALTAYFKTSASTTPSATQNVNGTPVTLTAPTTGLIPIAADWTTGSVSGETITALLTFTFNDATTGTVSPTATTSTTSSLSANQLLSLVKDGQYVTGISIAVQSTKNSSTATATLSVYGLNLV